MTTNHIDQLKEWWDEATPGIPKTGDTYIEDERHRGSSFRIVEAATDHRYGFENIRILSRAPKPKPAWHDAPAVIASTDYCERQVWQRDTTYGTPWYGTEGDGAVTSDLRDVTPLIEAKVTDEMVERGARVSTPAGVRYLHPSEVREVLTAALGLETA